VAESPRPLGSREVLRLPDFRKLFVAQAISDLGDGMTFMALLLLVNHLTHSPAAVAILSIAVAVPSMLGGIIGGTYADRMDRRTIMLASDSIRTLLVLGFVLVGTAERLPILYVVAFAQAAIGTFFSPARSALIPKVVPPEGLVAANSVGQMSRIIGNLLGSGLVGVVIATTGTYWPAFVLDAATFAASVLIVLRVDPALGRAPEHAEGARPGVGASAIEGLRIIGRSSTLLATVGGFAIAMLGLGAVNTLFVPFLVDTLGESPAWAGPLEGAQTVSMILAAGVVPVLARRLAPQSMIAGGLAGIGILVGALYLVPNAPVLLLVLFAVGWFVSPAQASVMTVLQTNTTDAVRGRVFGAMQAATSTATLLSTAAAGIFATVVGVRTVLLAGGVITLVAAVATLILFRFDRSPATPVGATRAAA
jgi:MFS family permease